LSEANITAQSVRRDRTIIVLLVLASLIQLARIGTVQSSTGEMPFLSANDRSRWCTILALTANGTFVIDDVLDIRDPNTKRRTWYSIDIVQHRGPDGKQHYYSSKPPLLSTIYAGVYWVLRGLTGATLTSQPFVIVRWMLILVNLLPLVGLWWLLARWANRRELNDGQVIALVIFAMFGNFLVTFVTTLNNHLPSAMAVAVSLICLQRILISKQNHPGWFVLCGLATSFAVATELPALSWLAVVGVLLWLANWRWTLLGYVPSLVPILLAFFGANYLAHGTLRPAYSMRDLGNLIVEVDWAQAGWPDDSSNVTESQPRDLTQIDVGSLRQVLRLKGLDLGGQPVVRKARRHGVWELWDETNQRRLALKQNGAGDKLGIYHWGDWYDFPTSYWKEDRKQGVDRGEPSRLRYALHCLIGHHGVFSLTPFWCVSLLGLAAICLRTPKAGWLSDGEFQLAVAIGMTSLVVMTFYLTRPLEDRNYGGVTSGLRWMFWFVPLWFWLAVRGMRLVRAPWQWWVVVSLLALSVFSAMYPWSNPWTTPWLSRWFPL